MESARRKRKVRLYRLSGVSSWGKLPAWRLHNAGGDPCFLSETLRPAPLENSPMRSLVIATVAVAFVAAAMTAPPAAHGRLFWQTYGSTVPTADGCAWNLNSDYFVPRHCDSCRYDLFSPCKTAHSLSPACKNLHPVYGGYCTPYGACHYRWRDHVYQKYCCCTPLRYAHGPWKLEKCRKHCGCLHGGGCEPSTGCVAGGSCVSGASFGSLPCVDGACGDEFAGVLHNVEPFGGEPLGEIAALPSNMAGASGAGLMGAAGQGLPGLPMPSPAIGGASFAIPGVFGN
jgi:hypothetical protein